MQFWYVRHPFNWYKDHQDKIDLGEPLIDSNWRKIRRFDKVIYFSHENPRGIVGLFNVESNGDWTRYRGARFQRYWYYKIAPLFLANRGKAPMKFSPKNDLGLSLPPMRTVIGLKPEQYKLIKEFLLGMPEPENHEGLVYLFAKTQDYIQNYLGFRRLKLIQTHYPDAIAVDERGKELGIEFEFDTVLFDHDPKDCDVIVCWKDGLGIAARPAGVKVIQLQPIYGSDPTGTEAMISQ